MYRTRFCSSNAYSKEFACISPSAVRLVLRQTLLRLHSCDNVGSRTCRGGCLNEAFLSANMVVTAGLVIRRRQLSIIRAGDSRASTAALFLAAFCTDADVNFIFLPHTLRILTHVNGAYWDIFSHSILHKDAIIPHAPHLLLRKPFCRCRSVSLMTLLLP